MATLGSGDDTTEAVPAGGTPFPGFSQPNDERVEEPRCSSIMFCDEPCDEPDCPCDDEDKGARACVTMECLWKGREILKVFFMNPDEYLTIEQWKYKGEVITTDKILEWANVWNADNDEKVPTFVEAKSARKSDIRVEFSDTNNCWSKVGMWADKVDSKKPTMMLNLDENFCHEDKRSLVIHEFGHALGLEHEHQRSDFWDGVEKHIDMDKMKDDPRVQKPIAGKGVACFGAGWHASRPNTVTTIRNFLRIPSRSDEDKKTLSQYDPHSIMHYGFDIDWLRTEQYRDRRKLEKISDEDLPGRKYLLGIHERRNGLSKDPSAIDLKTLKEAYHKVSGSQ